MSNLMFRVRYPFALTISIYCIFVAIILWVYVPHFDFGSWWLNDIYFVVRDVPPQSSAAGILQSADKVLSINGNPVRAGYLIAEPFQTSFEFIFERAGVVQSAEIDTPIWSNAYIYAERAPSTLLTLTYLIIGIILLASAADRNAVALKFGYFFITSAVFVLSIQGLVNGVPWAGISARRFSKKLGEEINT